MKSYVLQDCADPPTVHTERGHLALVHWENQTAGDTGPDTLPSLRWRSQSLRFGLTDAGIALLMLLSTGAVIASFLRVG